MFEKRDIVYVVLVQQPKHGGGGGGGGGGASTFGLANYIYPCWVHADFDVWCQRHSKDTCTTHLFWHPVMHQSHQCSVLTCPTPCSPSKWLYLERLGGRWHWVRDRSQQSGFGMFGAFNPEALGCAFQCVTTL